MTTPDKPYKVLILLYTGFNTLDVNGPLDVLCNFALRQKNTTGPFVVTTAAKGFSTYEPMEGKQTPVVVRSWEWITALADCTFDEVIPRIKAGEFDIMLLPGSGGNYVNDLVKDPSKPDQIVEVIKTFMNYDTKRGLENLKNPDKQNKWLFSVCTGAMVAGAAGCFRGRDATTHKYALAGLKKVCDAFNIVPKPNIIRKRWVFGGRADPAPGQQVKTNILSSGGISCGMDATLALVAKILNLESAWEIANVMDYNWNIDAEAPSSVDITQADSLPPNTGS